MANETRIGAPLKSAGGLFSAPLGSALPTDASTELDAAFVGLGHIGEDGIAETPERSIEQKRAWGGQIVRTIQTEYGLQVVFTFIERRDAVLKEVYGQDNVTVTAPVGGGTLRTVKLNKDTLPMREYVAEIKDGDARIRKVYPVAQVTETGTTTYTHSDLIMYEVTLTAYEDESGNNGYEYELIPAPAAA